MDETTRGRRQRPATGIGDLIGAGARLYDRASVLPRLLPLAPADLDGPEPALGRKLCAMLARALRAERNRGRAGHWSYDLNRHIGLAQALRAERAGMVRAGTRPDARRAGKAVVEALGFEPPDVL